MDKRKLYKDIARIRKQIFSVTAFTGFALVCLATLFGQGFDFYAVFRNSTFAIIGFGLLGYGLGHLYQTTVQEALIDSYRVEAQRRIDDLKNVGSSKRLAMKINVSELNPGMKVIDAIYNKTDGSLLVREGAVLTDRLIQTLRENNITNVKVEAQQSDAEEDDFA